MTAIPQDIFASPSSVVRTPRFIRFCISFAKRKPVAAASALVLLIVVLMCVFAPVLATADPNRQELGARLPRQAASITWARTNSDAIPSAAFSMEDAFPSGLDSARRSLAWALAF